MILASIIGTAAVVAALGLDSTGTAGGVTGASGTRGARPTVERSGPLDSLTVTYDVGGVKVIHRPTSVTDVVAVNLYLLGGSRQVTAVTAGIEPFALTASEYGTQRYPGDETRKALARTGSWITVETAPDYSLFSFRGIKQEFDSTWAVFAERLMHPTLDSAAVAIARGRLLMSLRAGKESPDVQVARIADSLAYESHPYANPTRGTETSIAALTAEDLRSYVKEQTVRSRMLLVVVGDIPRAQVERAVTSTLATLPSGNYVWKLPDPWTAKQPRVVTVQRGIPTNYILGYFAGPPQSSEDYPAFEVAVGYMGYFVGGFIRSEGLSYAAGAPLLRYGATGGGVYVSTVRPDTVMKIINEVIDLMQFGVLSRSDLVEGSKQYANGYYYEAESNAGVADLLGEAQLFRGDFRAASSYGDVLRKMTAADVRRAARLYMKNIQYAYLGDVSRVPLKVMLKQP
jgi:zinc protease